MNERFELAFTDILAANKNGDVKNLLITDDNMEYLDDALYALRSWSFKNSMNLVELDERDDSWLPEIQSRELFDKLNQRNTVLLIKNYATVNFRSVDDNTPRNFLRDAVMNRHYGCGNDFVPSDELPNLMFVVVINDLSEMYWREDEYSLFAVMHENDSKGAWVNIHISHHASKMHPVMSAVNRFHYYISEDETTICVDAGNAFSPKIVKLMHPIRCCSAEERTDIIHSYLEENLFCSYDKVECLILKMGRFADEKIFIVDATRLLDTFPSLKSVYCADQIDVVNNTNNLQILTPFEFGEYIFNITQTGEFTTANELTRKLWALDHKWARFYCEVAVDLGGSPLHRR